MSDTDQLELMHVFGLDPQSHTAPLAGAGLIEFAQWLRGNGRLAMRLREHLLGASPTDLTWHAPGEQFLERLSRVISSIETRASQMIENELPPERKERFFVDVISQPWDREDIVIDASLIVNLQRGLLSEDRYTHVCRTQIDGQPLRTMQNWVSSEKYDDMVGKAKVLHHLPPPPPVLADLLNGFFKSMQRMMSDKTMDPVVCATIAKVAFNTLHPLVDGNGRVQRALFQLVLFKYGFLPRLNVPVSVVMLQDRTGYEVMQQKHVDQMMAGVSYSMVDSEAEGDTYQHDNANDTIVAMYRYHDFTFAVSSMTKLMQSTLPVIAAKAYFLQRFDWRVDELLKGDALLPPRAATRIAKVFRNDGHGLSIQKLTRLFFLDGCWIGFRRICRFLMMARHPEDIFGWSRLRQPFSNFWSKSQRRFWIMSSGQQSASSSTGRVRWVGISLEKFTLSAAALARALKVSKPGDTVVAMHYPVDMNLLVSMDLFPQLAGDILTDIGEVRSEVQTKVQSIVDQHKPPDVEFKAFVGEIAEYKPAFSLCEDAKGAEVRPYRIYIGYDNDHQHRRFTDYVVRHAPCDVAIIKGDFSRVGTTRWVGLSSRNFDISGSALVKAFAHSRPGDTVVGVHYPTNPFEEEGLSSLYERHYHPIADEKLELITDSMTSRVFERAERLAEVHKKEGVTFQTLNGIQSSEPHRSLVVDAKMADARPHTIYVGYNRRRDRDRLVDPHKLYDVAEYIVRNAPCNVVVVKESQEEMRLRIKSRNAA